MSIQTSAPAKHASSASRIAGVKPPIRSRWLPGASHSPWISGSFASVAQLTMSAVAAAVARSVTTRAGMPSAASLTARRSADCSSRLHTITSSILRTAR